MALWVKNQYFCREVHFQLKTPVGPTSFILWRQSLVERRLMVVNDDGGGSWAG